MRDVKLGVLQCAAQFERKEMVWRYRISDQVSDFKSRSDQCYSTERHTVAINNPEGGSWRNAAGVPTCSALTDEGERSPFLRASCEKYPTVERIDSRGQYF